MQTLRLLDVEVGLVNTGRALFSRLPNPHATITVVIPGLRQGPVPYPAPALGMQTQLCAHQNGLKTSRPATIGRFYETKITKTTTCQYSCTIRLRDHLILRPQQNPQQVNVDSSDPRLQANEGEEHWGTTSPSHRLNIGWTSPE